MLHTKEKSSKSHSHPDVSLETTQVPLTETVQEEVETRASISPEVTTTPLVFKLLLRFLQLNKKSHIP
jgi:hypothetical protein